MINKNVILDYIDLCAHGASKIPIIIAKITFINDKIILSIMKPGFPHLNIPFIDIGLDYTDIYAYDDEDLYLVEGNRLLKTNYKFDLGYIEKYDFTVYEANYSKLEPILAIHKMIYNDSLLYKFYLERNI